MPKPTTNPVFADHSDVPTGPHVVTLRDYFAGQVLAGQSANIGWDHSDPDAEADRAYLRADAMLRRRLLEATGGA
jgi:hypothetical protein